MKVRKKVSYFSLEERFYKKYPKNRINGLKQKRHEKIKLEK